MEPADSNDDRSRLVWLLLAVNSLILLNPSNWPKIWSEPDLPKKAGCQTCRSRGRNPVLPCCMLGVLYWLSYFIAHVTLTADELCWLQLWEFCGFAWRQLQWQSADSWKTCHSCIARFVVRCVNRKKNTFISVLFICDYLLLQLNGLLFSWMSGVHRPTRHITCLSLQKFRDKFFQAVILHWLPNLYSKRIYTKKLTQRQMNCPYLRKNSQNYFSET